MRHVVVRRAARDAPVGQHFGERRPRPAHAALDRADRAAADRCGLFIGKAARAHQQQRLAPFGGQGQQRAVEIGEVDRFLLPGGGGEDAFGHALVILAAEAIAAHVGEVGVAQDHEGPGAHRGAGLEPVLRRPGLEQRLLHQIIGKVGPPAQPARKGAQVRHHRGQLALEIGPFARAALFTRRLVAAHLPPSRPRAGGIASSRSMRSLKLSGRASSTTES